MKVVLIDGNSLAYRAFFALPTDMATASGQVTNAVYGFTSMIINLLRDQNPDRIAVAFDLAEPTFRHEALSTYKAQRDATPELLIDQFGLIAEVLDALGIKRVSLAGYEADDIIATLATRARDNGDDVVVVTGDRDAYQLVEDPHVRVLYNKRGVSDYVLYDEAGIAERTGVTPDRYVDYAALRGDPSDNLPGVNGVGEKTAAKLITTYGTVDSVLANTDDQTPKLRENLREGAELARRNVELMRLVRDAPVPVELRELARPESIDRERVERCFAFLEFRGLYERLAAVVDLVGAGGEYSDSADLGDEPRIVEFDDTTELVECLDVLATGDGALIVAAVGAADGTQPRGVAMAASEEPLAVSIVDAEMLVDTDVVAALGALLSARPVSGHGVKELLRWFLDRGVNIGEVEFDTMLASYLLDPGRSSYPVEDLGGDGSGARTGTQGRLALDQPPSTVDQATRNVVTVAHSIESLAERLAARGMTDLFADIEVPLVGVLARMEHVGVGVDVAVLTELLEALTAREEHLSMLIQDDAGTPFNVNSTKQLREILFDRLGLEPQKKTKTGYSTDAATLEKLRGSHPIVEHLLEYREVSKLRSTYGEGLLAEVGPDGRIHATFNQTVARTGRLSSDRPNLHNIPVRSELGREFRRAFVPRPGTELLVADYNQVELRCIAHLSGDPGLVEAFSNGEDIHASTAARVFGVPVAEVTHEQRARAKMVSYGLAYGMEAYGLAQRLGIDVADAAGILDAYFDAFPSVRAYMDATVKLATERGYTETLFGRRRPIPELASPNARLRAAGERQAMNAGIQGLAADLFKIALIRLDAELRRGGHGSTLILQVHDEVLLEVPPEEKDEIARLTRQIMMGAADLSVPLEVNLAFGANWSEAKQ